ncbi:MAG: hypothetical protein JWP66_1896 [Naasia sp.]|nr:hypothetical protein [Naasia sp.]
MLSAVAFPPPPAAPTHAVQPSRAVRALDRLRDVLHDASLALFAFTVFFSYLAGVLIPLPYVVIGAVWLYALTEIVRRTGRSLLTLAWAVVPPVLTFAMWLLYQTPRAEREFVTLPAADRDFLVLALVGIVGGLLAGRDPRIGSFVTALRATAAVTAALALVEKGLGEQLFPGNIVTGGFGKDIGNQLVAHDGGIRVLVAAEHPLILGLLLTAVLPFVLARPVSLLKVLELALLLTANWATDSIGPFWLGVAVVAIGLAWPRRWRARALMPTWVAALVALAGLALLIYAMLFVWTTDISNGRPGGDGARYRTALLSLVPDILATHPFGYGPAQIPANTLFVDAGDKLLDVSKTVDSQITFWVIQVGILGFLAYCAISWLAIRGIARGAQSPLTTMPLFLVTLLGSIVALTCWASVSVFWLFLAAAAVTVPFAGQGKRART